MLRFFALTLALGSAVGAAEDYRRTVANSTGSPELCVTWNRRDLTWHSDAAGSLITPGDSEFVAVDAAWQTWQALSDTCSDFTFTRGARVTKPKIGKGSEDASVVVFREAPCPTEAPCVADGSCAELLGCWDHSANTIGLTTVTYSTRTGVAIDADIELNASNFLFTTVASPPCEEGREAVTCVAYDVQNTVTHEIGHVVGFDHVFDSPASTMAPTAAVGDTQKRIVDLGTATGFCGTYPRGQPPVPCDALAQLQRRIIATNVGSFGCSCANLAPATPLGALVALALMTMLRRRAG
jgi:hypothetical protein